MPSVISQSVHFLGLQTGICFAQKGSQLPGSIPSSAASLFGVVIGTSSLRSEPLVHLREVV